MLPVERVLFGAVLAGAFASTSACGSTASPASDAATFTAIYNRFFPTTTNPRCSFCHGLVASDTSNGRLSMGTDKATAYAALVGKSSTSSHCSGRPLVTPGDPDGSLFLQKVADPTPPCGDRMPLGGAVLTSTEIEMIRSWIEAGAKDD